ncbi:MAG: putative extracellular nuclease [Polyangiales bacterium]|jgi:predicted extracellular nuclease
MEPAYSPRMDHDAPLTPIHVIQGESAFSPFAGKTVKVRGVVTGRGRRGYFVQSETRNTNPFCSDAIFVFSPRRKAKVGSLVELTGKVLDFVKNEGGRPTTQLKVLEAIRLEEEGPEVAPIWLNNALLPSDATKLAQTLNGLEGMLVGIEAGSVFTAPSNPFGDYVCVPKDVVAARTKGGGILVDADHPSRWFPGFRIVNRDSAPKLNVGATLLEAVTGPLNYRANAFQMVASSSVKTKNASVPYSRVSFERDEQATTILTLNGFNLDAHLEDPSLVDSDRDVDDDVRYGRFELLAKAIVKQADSPDIIALQEIQDNDGAEITEVVDATDTYNQLARDILFLGGPEYAWADIPPAVGEDGGQPGGNIRNGYLYNPARVTIEAGSLRRLGDGSEAYDGSRKPLMARFKVRSSGASLDVVNVHLASKRHQKSIFAPEQPGVDAREPVRVAQAQLIRQALEDRQDPVDYYVTGDFNDYEFSATLNALCGEDAFNMVYALEPDERFDYNHRGQLQVLMHGVVPRSAYDEGRVQYQILHGNELTGVKPGADVCKASDHAYVIAQIRVHE